MLLYVTVCYDICILSRRHTTVLQCHSVLILLYATVYDCMLLYATIYVCMLSRRHTTVLQFYSVTYCSNKDTYTVAYSSISNVIAS